jgi:hypothetical protein
MEQSVASSAAVFALAVWALGASPTASAEHLFRGMETGDLSEWRTQFYRDYGAQVVTSPDPNVGTPCASRCEAQIPELRVPRSSPI